MNTEMQYGRMIESLLKLKDQLKGKCSVDQVYLFVIVLLFLCFSYYNIFQQARLQVQLPYVDVVKFLKNGESQLHEKKAEAFSDLYTTVSSHFDSTYKNEYLTHYNNYGVLLAPVLIFTRKYIGLMYRMRSTQYRNGIGSNLDRAVFQTSKMFIKTPDNWVSPYSMGPVPGPLSFRNTKSAYKQFLYTCIYPMYKAGRPELEPPLYNLDQTLTGYKVIEWIQITVFVLGLLLETEVISAGFYRRSSIAKLLSVTYIMMLVLVGTCACLSVTFVINKRSPVYGTFNSVLDFFQMVFMLLIGCFLKRLCLEMNLSSVIMTRSEPVSGHVTQALGGCRAPPVSTIDTGREEGNGESPKNDVLRFSGIGFCSGSPVAAAGTRKRYPEGSSESKHRRELAFMQNVYEEVEAEPEFLKDRNEDVDGNEADDELEDEVGVMDEVRH